MTHAEWIDPNLARRHCTPDELEIVIARNYEPPMSWKMIGAMTGRSRGVVRRIWGQANQKVNGGYVPPSAPVDDSTPLPAGYVRPKREQAGTARAIRATDPDVIATWRGIPVSGAGQSAIKGTVPGQSMRSGK